MSTILCIPVIIVIINNNNNNDTNTTNNNNDIKTEMVPKYILKSIKEPQSRFNCCVFLQN